MLIAILELNLIHILIYFSELNEISYLESLIYLRELHKLYTPYRAILVRLTLVNKLC